MTDESIIADLDATRARSFFLLPGTGRTIRLVLRCEDGSVRGCDFDLVTAQRLVDEIVESLTQAEAGQA